MLLLRCGIKPEIYLETRDFQNIREFHTKELVNLFGVAASDMSEMALGEVADTIRKLQIQERKQRTFVERKTADYNVDNKQETTTERRQDNGSNHIQQTGRLSPAESYNSRGRGSSPWEVRISPKSISDEESVRNVSEPSDSRNLESASASDRGRSTDENGNRMETLIQQMTEKEGVTEELKARDQMEWIGQMNNIRQRAQEIVRNEILEN